MKKVINGKTYNTDTATHLACCTNAEGYEETIYQKRDGTYFMHVKNAENTIRPLTRQEAWDWAETHLTPEACRDAFGFVRTNNEEGVCPLCGSRDLEYPCGGEIDDVGVNYDWKCKNCGASGREGFSRVFDEHLHVHDEEGNEITILPLKEVPRIYFQRASADRADIRRALQCLEDNGIEKEECPIVLQALGYILCDTELEPLFNDDDYEPRTPATEPEKTDAPTMLPVKTVKKLIQTIWDCGQEDGREDYCIACDIVDMAEVTPEELVALGFEEIAKAYATPTEPKAYRIG